MQRFPYLFLHISPLVSHIRYHTCENLIPLLMALHGKTALCALPLTLHQLGDSPQIADHLCFFTG